MPSTPKRRPTVGDTVKVVRVHPGNDATKEYLGRTGKIQHDSNDHMPYRLDFSGIYWYFSDEVELVEAGTSEPDHDALWYVNALAAMLKYSVSRPADWNGTYVLLNGTCHDGHDLDAKVRAATCLTGRDTTGVDMSCGVAIRDGSPDGRTRENTTKYWRWLYERVLATKGLA